MACANVGIPRHPKSDDGGTAAIHALCLTDDIQSTAYTINIFIVPRNTYKVLFPKICLNLLVFWGPRSFPNN